MENESETTATARAEARTARLLALIFGGLIVALIAIMMSIDLYADAHGHDAPTDAAEHRD